MPPARKTFTSALRASAALGLAAACALPPRAAFARTAASSITVLTRDDFARSNNFSLSEVLDQAVGIDVEREGYRGTAARARLRGLPNTRSLVIAVDGRPISQLYEGAVDLSAIPLNAVERIEITRGGAPLAYGPSAAGVVNVITSRPSYRRLMVDLETAAGRDGVRQHNGRFYLRSWPGDLTYIGGLQDSGGFTFNDESELDTHFVNLTRSFRKGGYWGAEYASVEGWSGTPDGSTLPIGEWNGYDERLPINPTGVRSHQQRTFRLLGASPEVGGGTIYGEFTQAGRDVERDTARRGGTEIEDRETAATEGRLRWEGKTFAFGGDAAALTRRWEGAPKREATLAGAFAQSRFAWGAFEFAPGARFDRHSEAGGGLSARVSAVFRPTDRVAFSASGQHGSRFPTFDELYPSAGTPHALDPEHVKAYDAGVALEGTGYRIALTGFDTRIDDAIAFDPASARSANAGEDRARGAELEAGLTVGEGPWRWMRLSGHFTVRDADRRAPGAARFETAPLSPRRLAFARFEYLLPRKITMINEFRYESEQFEGAGKTGRRLPPFGLWNLRFNARIHSAIVFVAAENLGRRRYAEAFGSSALGPDAGLAPQPERTFWVGASIRFLD